jgi:hypothetical protein
MTSTPPGTEAEAEFCDLIVQLGKEQNVTVKRAPLWPQGKRFALTIRHDCDRPVKLRDMLNLLFFYRKHRVRASFGILQNRISYTQLWLIKLFGHEINLHSVAASKADLTEEKHMLSELAGQPIRGFHSHGGAGSEGFLGDRHYEWAQAASFEYVEMLGRSTRQPHAINRIIDGLPKTTNLVAPGVHFSLDAGMGRDEHHYDFIASSAKQAIETGSHIVLMNHPDLHLDELRRLILLLIHENPWNATLAETCRWYHSSRMPLETITNRPFHGKP